MINNKKYFDFDTENINFEIINKKAIYCRLLKLNKKKKISSINNLKMNMMKTKNLIIISTLLGLMTLFSCKNKDAFEQPTIDVKGFSLQELPGEYTNLNVDIELTNNDSREATIADASYQVVIEGAASENMTADINKEILVGTPLKLTLPLTLKTKDAIQLLAKLDAGQQLNYSVTGTFHADEPIIKRFDLPIDVQGTANVDVGYEDFYEQPDVTVTDISVSSSGDDVSGYTYNFDVSCDVKNNDTRSVSTDEIEYTVTIAGLTSETHLYSDTYTYNFSVNGGATTSLTLPVTLNLSASQKTDLDNAIAAGTVNYSVEGTFHAVEVDGSPTDFILPLYITGSISVGDMFEHPDIKVNTIDGTYTVVGYPVPTGYIFDLNCNTTVTNNDTRNAVIDEIVYTVTTEGVVSETHYYTDTYSTDLSVSGSSSVDLILPVTYNLSATEGATLLNGLTDGTANYTIDGTFHVISVDGEPADLTLPLHDTGSVPVTSLTQSKK